MLRQLLRISPGFEDPALNEQSSEPEVNKWVVSEFVVKKLVPVVGVHPFPLDELMLMTSAVCRFKPEAIFEWGTNIGKSARVFYEVAKAFSVSTHIHSIDLPDEVHHNEHPRSDRGKLVAGCKGVTLHQADGLSKSLELVKKLEPKGRVLFFVDGDHSYDSVRRELSAILKEVPQAVVLAHDTFYQSKSSNYNIGPHEAIRDVIAGQNGIRTLSTAFGLPGMSLLYRDDR